MSSTPTPTQESARPRKDEQIYEHLIDMIISGEIAAGQRLSVDGLVRQFGVSQTPIRRALTLLEADGLAHNSYLAGYTATPKLTAGELDDLFELRHIIEPPAAALAAERATAEQLAEITTLSERMVVRDQSGNPMDYGAFARLDSQFHEAIVAASQNAMLHRSYVMMHAHVHMFRLLFNRTVTADALTEHAEILDSLREKSSERARSAVSAHLEQSHARLRTSFFH